MHVHNWQQLSRKQELCMPGPLTLPRADGMRRLTFRSQPILMPLALHPHNLAVHCTSSGSIQSPKCLSFDLLSAGLVNRQSFVRFDQFEASLQRTAVNNRRLHRSRRQQTTSSSWSRLDPAMASRMKRRPFRWRPRSN